MSQTSPVTSRGAPRRPRTTDGNQRRQVPALLVIVAAQLMVVLDATIVNVALPHIQRALGFSGTGLEWVITVYTLSFGGLLLLGGHAGDILGRRPVFIGGLAVFSAVSLAGGFATSQAWLLTAPLMPLQILASPSSSGGYLVMLMIATALFGFFSS